MDRTGPYGTVTQLCPLQIHVKTDSRDGAPTICEGGVTLPRLSDPGCDVLGRGGLFFLRALRARELYTYLANVRRAVGT